MLHFPLSHQKINKINVALLITKQFVSVSVTVRSWEVSSPCAHLDDPDLGLDCLESCIVASLCTLN